MNAIKWDNLFLNTDVNSSYNDFYGILDSIINTNSKDIDFSSKLAKAKVVSPWITSRILYKIKRRQKLYKISKSRPYDRVFIRYFGKYCQDLKLDIDKAKYSWFKNQIENCSGNSGQQWKVINSLTGSSNNKSVQMVELDNGETVDEPSVVARVIGDYLVSVQEEVVAGDSGHHAHTQTQPLPSI